MILNIETSSKICSVALCEEGAVWFELASGKEMDHASRLGPFVDSCMQELKIRDKKLDAVAVSIGPGSYTGLRIGLSLAKGLCFGLNIPLIGIPTLKTLAVKAMFKCRDFKEDRIYIPMIDARRMEVYTAAYNNALEEVLKASPLILSEDSYSEFEGKPIIMIGDGVEKAREVVKIKVEDRINTMPLARDMNALSEQAFLRGDFIDIAYSTPLYLKNFQATTPKKNVLFSPPATDNKL